MREKGSNDPVPHVPGLEDEEGPAIHPGQTLGEHPALAVHGDAFDAFAPQAQQPEGLEDAPVSLLAQHHPDPGRARQTLRAAVPAGTAEQLVASCGKAAQRGHRGAPDEACRGSLGEPQEAHQPFLAGGLQRR